MNNNPLIKSFLKIMGNEKRQTITIPLLAIFLSLLVSSVIILLLDANPIEVFKNFLQGSGLIAKEKYAGGKSVLTDFMSFMNEWTPMLFASLSVMIALKAGLFNIGVSGQMLFAGFIATIVVGYSPLTSIVAKPLALVIGFSAGAFIGAFVGLLKHKFNINEVVSTIMLNYISQYVISFFIQTSYINPVSRQSNPVNDASRWTLVNTQVGDLKMDIPLGIILAILTAIIMHFVIKKTTFGYEIKSIGLNKKSSKYSGINVGRNLILTMVISGGLAGLAGVMYYLGLYGSIQPRTLSATGFDSIAVALLANNHPIGIIFSSFLITIISKGSTYMSSSSGLQPEIASLITGIILLFSACTVFFQYKVKQLSEKYNDSNSSKEGGEK